ncbi:hypothetical protein Tco_0162964 [Tanacetum coccineum]
MFLNMDQLEKQLDNEEFQEIGSMAAFKVPETQFQMFIKLQIYLDDEYVVMTRNYFLQYTQLEIREFRDTLMQHMESIKNSIDKRSLCKREYDSWVNERQMKTIEEKVDTNIRPIYNEEPMAEVQTTAEINVFATGQQHTEQPKFNNEGESERPRILKPRFSSQVDVNNDLSKPVTTHYLPKERESAFVKPHHVISSRKSRNSSKNMPRFSSNDMVHNHYLDEARKKTQEKGENSEPSVMSSAKSQSTANDSKPKPGSITKTLGIDMHLRVVA